MATGRTHTVTDSLRRAVTGCGGTSATMLLFLVVWTVAAAKQPGPGDAIHAVHDAGLSVNSESTGATNAVRTWTPIVADPAGRYASVSMTSSGIQLAPTPPAPAPTGTVIKVSTEPQLQLAMKTLRSDTTVVLAAGTYALTSTLTINGHFTNVGIRGLTNNRDDVVLVGPGMTRESSGNASSGIWTGNGVQGVTIADLTIRDFAQHLIVFNGGTQNPLVHNVHLINAGEQFIKSNPDGVGGGVNNGIVEYSVIEYTTRAKNDYTNGVDVHTGANWIIRHNLFRNIVGPPGPLAGPAVLMWNHSRDTLTEGNGFLNCARGISYGLVKRNEGSDHVGGVIRNNVFFRSSNQPGDAGILVADSPNTLVLNNTVFVSGTYGTPIEYRFAGSTGIALTNNLHDGVILARDGAKGSERTNVGHATSAMFVDAMSGDLHLSPSATTAIGHGTSLREVFDDRDGKSRRQGAYDIGAYEYNNGNPPGLAR